jgi:hypothetical protein
MKGRASDRPSRDKLALVPPELAEAIRAATLDEDIDRLSELIDGVAPHDAEVAEYLRLLLEDVAYDTLADLFDARGR